MFDVIALDLEGTLISSAISQIPRPGLYNFLVECKRLARRVAMFTAVREPVFRTIAETLCEDGFAPTWFQDIEYVEWDHGMTKSLNFIKNARIERCVIIDDLREYIHTDQYAQYIHIQQFTSPYSKDDDEFAKIVNELKNRVSNLQHYVISSIGVEDYIADRGVVFKSKF